MKKTTTTVIFKNLMSVCMPVLVALSMAFTARAQVDPCAMGSIGQVNYSIKPQLVIPTPADICQSQLTPLDFQTIGSLIGNVTACPNLDHLQVQILRGGVMTPAFNAGNAFVGSADVGRTFQVSVTQVLRDPNNPGAFVRGNTSWGYITVECKNPPVVRCPLDATINCAQISAGGTVPVSLTGNIVAGTGVATIPTVAGGTQNVPAFVPNPTVVTGFDGAFLDCCAATSYYQDYTFTTNCATPFTGFGVGAGLIDVTSQGLPASIVTPARIAALNALIAANPAGVSKIVIRCWTVKKTINSPTGGSDQAPQPITIISDPCYQLIFVQNANIAVIVCPTPNLVYSCAAGVPGFLNIANLDPATVAARSGNLAAYPTLGGAPLIPSTAGGATNSCGITVTCDDKTTFLCGAAGSYRITRTWVIIDCAGRRITCVQTLSILDLTPPTVTGTFQSYTSRLGDCNTNPLTQTTLTNTWTGRTVLGVATPSTPVFLNALGSPNNCGGCASFTFVASDPFCTGGAVTFTSNDSRFVASNYVAGVTSSVTFTGCYMQLGVYNVTFTAADACGNALATQTYTINVIDNIKPVPVCIQITQVALTTDGTARVYAQTFDEGSHDNCGIDHIAVRRMIRCDGTAGVCADFAPYVDFCCTDSSVQVVFRVYDYAGNFNDCMVQVLVVNKVAPTCIAPEPRTVSCLRLNNLGTYDSEFGAASFYGNCGFTVRKDSTFQFTDRNCKIGNILRTFTVTNAQGTSAVCTQLITIQQVSDFTVDFPDDVITACISDPKVSPTALKAQLLDPTNAGKIDGNILNAGCGVMGVEIKDDTITSDPNFCFKIFRHIIVIDWCKYNVNNDAVDFNVNCYGQPVDGDIHSVATWATTNQPAWQNIHAAYGIGTGIDPRTRRFRDADVLQFGPLNIDNLPPDLLNPTHPYAFSDGIISYTQIIKIKDTIAPIFVRQLDTVVCDLGGSAIQGQSVCSGVFNYTFKATDGCSSNPNNVTYSAIVITTSTGAVFGTYSSATVSAALAYGVTYTVKATATDRCGNFSVTQFNVTLRDCKKPSIICKNVNAESMLMVNNVGATTIWATDLLASPLSDNCTVVDSLNKRLIVVRHGAFASYPTTVAPKSITFTCTDYNAAPSHTVLVDLWTMDDAGNADFCVSQIVLQDNLGICVPGISAAVAGGVATESQESVENVNVAAVNGSTVMGSQTTAADGSFKIAGLKTGDNVQVHATRNDDPRNGVTTYDIALISKHILGIQALNSPYKLIAADVNKDAEINAVDMLQLRKLILHISDAFTNNTSWRFVDKNYVFQHADNPFGEDFREVVNINSLPTSSQANFIAVKVGDVNGSAIPNSLLGATVRNNNGALTFNVEDVKLVPGQEYSVSFKSDNFNASAFQFTTNFTKGAVEILNVKAGELNNLTENNFGKFENAITTSWNGNATGNVEAFTVTFKANTSAKLSDILSIGSNLTTAEANNVNGDVMNVQLKFNSGKVSGNEFALYQNEPNPAINFTKVGFNLPESTKATLTVYDVSGKVLTVKNGDFAKGFNEFSLTKSEIGATGVLYYRLDTPANSATKKMIIIE